MTRSGLKYDRRSMSRETSARGRRFAVLLALTALTWTACPSRREPAGGSSKQTTPPDPLAPAIEAFDADAAYRHLVALTDMGLRDSGTPGAQQAAEYLRDQLIALGLDVAFDVFTNTTPRGPTVFRNVIGRTTNRAESIVILGSHYDTKSGMPAGFQGANDSGSSTAVLLELARVLADRTPTFFELWFAFFDGEESMVRYGPNDGFHGSIRLAQYLADTGKSKSVKAVIVLDMVGDCDLTITIPRNSTPWLVQTAFDAARDEGVREKFSYFRNEIGDDHEPFLNLGMPAVDLIDFHFGSRPGLNDYWHTAEDRIERVCAESLGIMGRVTLRMLNRLAAGGRQTD